MPATRRAPRAHPESEVRAGRVGRYDAGRETRTGVPEVVLAEGKSPAHLVEILEALRRRGRGALVSRPAGAHRRAIEQAEREGRLRVRRLAGGRLLRLEGPLPRFAWSGVVAVVTAGTSDVPAADEALAVLQTYGVRTVSAFDVGVAGLHRLSRAIRRLEKARPSVYLAFAGREGALPTVLAGLVKSPVVGVPTSVGYGRGGRGEAALTAMLQSCAPIAVVNIDAAVPAALFALHLLAGARPTPGSRR